MNAPPPRPPQYLLPQPPLIVAALGTGAAVGLLWLTETHDPGGSAVGWLIMGLLLAAHWPLLMPPPPKPRLDVVYYIPPAWVGWSAIGAVLLLGAALLGGMAEQMQQAPVLPRASAQLGMLDAAAARFAASEPLFFDSYPRQGYVQANPHPPALVALAALPRALGLELRFLTLLAIAATMGLLVWAVLLLLRSGWKPAEEGDAAAAFLAVFLAGALWMTTGYGSGFLNWNHTVFLLPWTLLLGLGAATGRMILGAAAAGILAGMNPGWLLLLPVAGAFFLKERPRPAVLAALLIPPILSYGTGRREFEAMLTGLLRPAFENGVELAEGATAWRYATLHGWTDWAALRPAVYALGLAAQAWAVVRIARSNSPQERLGVLAFAAFAVVGCGPTAYTFHWVGHGVLLAGLVPAAAAMAAREQQQGLAEGGGPFHGPDARATVLAVGLPTLLLLWALLPWVLRLNADAVNQRRDYRLTPMENLALGWNVPSWDHAWTKETSATIGFFLDKRYDGLLELRIGTLGGAFTPYNPIEVRLNGQEMGRYLIAPGDVRFALIPVRAEQLLIGFNTLELNGRWVRTPRSAGVYPDDRQVGIIYEGLRLLPWQVLDLKELPAEVRPLGTPVAGDAALEAPAAPP